MKKLNRIKIVLVEKDISQTELAEKMGVSRASINAICSNRSQPSLKKLSVIAEILDVDICDLLVSNLETKK